MKAFFETYYGIVSSILLIGALTLAFFIGKEEGKRRSPEGSSAGVAFSCSEDMLSAFSANAIGEVRKGQRAPGNTTNFSEESTSVVSLSPRGAFVGSKNGTKYYTPGCPGSQRIKPENYIWFESAEDATLQGYSKGSC